MSERIEVKSLKLGLGKKEIDLTIEEAKKLHEALSAIFGEKLVRHEHHYDQWYWNTNPWISVATTATGNPPTNYTVANGIVQATL